MIEHIHRAVAIASAAESGLNDVAGFVPDDVWDKLHLEGHVRYDVDQARTVATPEGLNWLKRALHAVA